MDEFVAQLERQPDGQLVAVLYVNGGRAHTEPVRSLRQGKRRAHDLLCTGVDTQGKAFTGVHTDLPTQSPDRDLGRDQVSSARTARRGVHRAGSRPRRVVAAYRRLIPVWLISRRGWPFWERGTNRGRLRGLVLPVGVGGTGVPASVVVGEGVVE